MRFYEYQINGYITQYGKGGAGGETITEERYNAILDAVADAPEETDEIGYRLKSDLTWEQYEKEPEPEPDPTPEEALDFLFGGDES